MKWSLALLLFAGCKVNPNLLVACDDHCHVVPVIAVSSDIKDHLRTTSPGFVCAPDRAVEEGGYYPLKCTAFKTFEGRCLGTCIPEVKQVAVLLNQETCFPGEVCVPCYNPFSPADATGACSIGTDKPSPSPSP